MKPQNLSNTERLILANQFEILGHLKKDDSYLHLAEDLRDGHEWIYEQRLRVSEIIPAEKVEYILIILGIYSDIRDSYNQLSDKSGIEEHLTTFPGFDGNNESEFLHFAQALSRNNNFSETIGKNARNSHMPTTEIYCRMISEWEKLGKPRFPLSKEQIQNILDARIHPSNRKNP